MTIMTIISIEKTFYSAKGTLSLDLLAHIPSASHFQQEGLAVSSRLVSKLPSAKGG